MSIQPHIHLTYDLKWYSYRQFCDIFACEVQITDLEGVFYL